jgi:hypothetical protein
LVCRPLALLARAILACKALKAAVRVMLLPLMLKLALAKLKNCVCSKMQRLIKVLFAALQTLFRSLPLVKKTE